MKICKHGDYDSDIQVTCQNCGCIFTYKKKELRTLITFDFETQTGLAEEFIPCPECDYHYRTDRTIELLAKEKEEEENDEQEPTEPVYDEDGNEEL